MKKIFYSAVVVLLLAAGCSKDKTVFMASATMNVINATVGSVSVKVNTGIGTSFAWSKTTAADGLAYGSNRFYASNIGTNTVSVVSTADTTQILFSKPLTLESVNTLYLIGTVAAVDTMFRVERNLPLIDLSKLERDNAAYIRFVNLSSNSGLINVNIRSATGNEVTGLAYKGVSVFKKYDAIVGAGDYIFEIRDASNNILATYQISSNNVRFKTLSLVLRGIVGATGADAFGISPVSYYN